MTMHDGLLPRRRRRTLALLVLPLLAAGTGGALLSAAPAQAADGIFVVTSNADGIDTKPAPDGICRAADGTCTLRAALREANAYAGAATIQFAVASPATGPIVIAPQKVLPSLTNPSGITIDGFSQPGSSPNTDPLVDNSVIRIELKGKGSGTFDGLTATESHNTFRGLAVYNFNKSIYLNGELSGGGSNRVVGTHICTDAAGVFGAAKVLNPQLGVYLYRTANNVIGAPGPENRNVVSGCGHRGVTLSFTGTIDNKIQNNIMGLNPSGTAALPNRAHAVDVNYTRSNLVGGTGFQERNVLSGNTGSGAEISHGRANTLNSVVGNYIGTDVNGIYRSYTTNGNWGVRLEGFFSCDTCDDSESPEGVPSFITVSDNVIAGNAKGGIHVDKGHHDDTIIRNTIGKDLSGAAVGNGLGRYGIRIEHGARRITISNNEIAYNGAGVQIVSSGSAPGFSGRAPTNDNRITANSIHDNTGLGIDLMSLAKANTGNVGELTVNHGMQSPVITSATLTTVSGTSKTRETGVLAPCVNCTVEVFSTDTATAGQGEGKTLLATGTTNGSGAFSIAVPAQLAGSGVTVTSTDPTGSTSEFALSVVVAAARA